MEGIGTTTTEGKTKVGGIGLVETSKVGIKEEISSKEVILNSNHRVSNHKATKETMQDRAVQEIASARTLMGRRVANV